MIDRVMQRRFVLAWIAGVASGRLEDSEIALPTYVAGVTDEDLQRVSQDAELSFLRQFDAQVTWSEEEDTRRGDDLPLEEFSYVPDDPFACLVQAALDLYYAEYRSDLIETSDIEDDRRDGDDEIPPVTDQRLRLDDDQIPDEATLADEVQRRLAGPFEPGDIRWVTYVVAQGMNKVRGPHPFAPSPAPPFPLEARSRVVLVGDWASGIPRARNVAQQISTELADAERQAIQAHVVHLGDTYYAGFPREYRKRFLPYWPVKLGDTHYSWACNGNHDMVSGGYGFFDTLLLDPRFAAQHRSSWFSLVNSDWQLLGLDTAWEDQVLHEPQATWVSDCIRNNPDKKTMLLSHHPPFGTRGDSGERIRHQLAGPLSSEGITAWFWGHEHQCVGYKDGYFGIGYPRCIGHGGIPVYVPPAAGPPAAWNLRDGFWSRLQHWAFFGFAALDFDGPHLFARYIDEDGVERHNEQIA